jgi:hypothetical protein
MEKLDKRNDSMHDGESITDELREFAPHLDLGKVALAGWKEGLLAIADRIDAEHQKAIRELNNLADGSVLLPVDADGVPIHIGDVMDSKVDYLFDGKPFTVRGLVLCEDGWEVTDGRFGNRYKPDSLRHHHEPTVEDVLREFAYGLGVPVADSYIAATAAKLQLRGGAE